MVVSNDSELQGLKEIGRICAATLNAMAAAMEPGMTTSETTSSPVSVTAAILVIGDEILYGRTKDKNIGYIAEYLTNIGLELR